MSAAPSPALQRFLHAAGESLRRGDIGGAMTIAEQAATQGLEDPNLLVLAGQLRMRNGKPDRALPILLRAREMAPDNIEALNALGLCLTLLGNPREALAVFDDAIARAPDTVYLKLHQSQALEDAGYLTKAQAALETVLAAQPANAQALARLAGLQARRGDMAKARDTATRALKLGRNPAATIALAMAELEDGAADVARKLLVPLLVDSRVGPINQSIAYGLTGDAFDALGKPAEAFGAYIAARETLRPPLATLLAGKESAVGRVRRLAAYFRAAPAQAWAASSVAAASAPRHVFLVGFPRSGTTLLEQALASHGAIRTLEEADCLQDAIAQFVDTPDGLDSFAALDEAGLEKIRAQYWDRVAQAGGRTDRAVFIDKMPLNAIHLGLVSRLFPTAKILFAIRDPRDVVLSCFRRRLVMTAHMFEFTRLDTAAAFYDAVMDLAQLYRGTLGLPTLDLRHEDMLADFDGELRRVTDFLGLDWDAAMRDFAVHARGRDIKTPSALQVVRGLNTDGIGQWRRFAAQMSPVLPVLQPWAQHFGYED